ncbi:MAG: molecular chaperone TorD family protein [Gammaproteobacteria bacterium]
MLLVEPDAAARAALSANGYLDARGLAALRIEFADRLCHRESARYVAPYEHVFRRRWQTRSGWRFPAPEPGGSADVERCYALLGFSTEELPFCAEHMGDQPAADHLGAMLYFAARCLESGGTGNGIPPLLVEFTQAHLGIWVEEFCLLLIRSGAGAYLHAVADAVFEAVERIRCLCTGSERAEVG